MHALDRVFYALAMGFAGLTLLGLLAPRIAGIIYPFLQDKTRGTVTALNLMLLTLFAVLAPTDFELALEGATKAGQVRLPTSGQYVSDSAAVRLGPDSALQYYDLTTRRPSPRRFAYEVYRSAAGDTLLVDSATKTVLRVSLDTARTAMRLTTVYREDRFPEVRGVFVARSLDSILAARVPARQAALPAAEECARFRIVGPVTMARFADHTADYKCTIVTLSNLLRDDKGPLAIFKINWSLRRFAGKSVRFTQGVGETRVEITLPEDLTLPNAGAFEPVAVTFRCGKGQLSGGNVATAVTRN